MCNMNASFTTARCFAAIAFQPRAISSCTTSPPDDHERDPKTDNMSRTAEYTGGDTPALTGHVRHERHHPTLNKYA